MALSPAVGRFHSKTLFMRHLQYILLLLLVSQCNPKFTGYTTSGERPTLLDADAFALKGVAEDPQYGYTSKSPVHVGGWDDGNTELYVRRYLNALRAPNGEPIDYQYVGECCYYESPRDQFGEAFLVVYEITYPGQALSPLVLHLDVYHYDALYAPDGLDYRRE